MTNSLWNQILKIAFRILCFIFHIICAVKFWGKRKIVPPVENKLLLKSATLLAKEIREQKIKSEDVIQAYIDRIIEVDGYINATVDRCFHKALEEARNADHIVASGEHTMEQLVKEKPFLGVPLTVKLIFKVKGLRCTAGSTFFTDQVALEDSPCVVLMKRAGAIVIATTNIPEIAMHIETNNKVHGITSNPYDTTRTCGGSSGGEGALISAGGSLIGLGNDLAGSIRIPSHMNGIFGHKPTAGLVPNGGCFPSLDFLEQYLYTGPLCRYAEDMDKIMEVLSSEHKIPLNFGITVKFENLKVRYMTQINTTFGIPVNEEIIQGLEKVASYFRKACGADVKEVKIPLMNHANECFFYNLMLKINKLEDLKATITDGKGAHVNEILDLIKYLFGKSTFSQGPLIALIFKELSFIYKKDNHIKFQKLLEDLEKEFENLLDYNSVFLLPTFPTTAPYHHEILPLVLSSCYNSIFNALGFPSTHCPLGLNKQGLPYGIQVIGRKNNDPLTIACAKELEKVFGGWIPPKNT